MIASAKRELGVWRDVYAEAIDEAGIPGATAASLTVLGSLLWRTGDAIDAVGRDVERAGEVITLAGHSLYNVAHRILERQEARRART